MLAPGGSGPQPPGLSHCCSHCCCSARCCVTVAALALTESSSSLLSWSIPAVVFSTPAFVYDGARSANFWVTSMPSLELDWVSFTRVIGVKLGFVEAMRKSWALTCNHKQYLRKIKRAPECLETRDPACMGLYRSESHCQIIKSKCGLLE